MASSKRGKVRGSLPCGGGVMTEGRLPAPEETGAPPMREGDASSATYAPLRPDTGYTDEGMRAEDVRAAWKETDPLPPSPPAPPVNDPDVIRLGSDGGRIPMREGCSALAMERLTSGAGKTTDEVRTSAGWVSETLPPEASARTRRASDVEKPRP